MEIKNPATGQIIEKINQDDPESITKKFAATKEAQTQWAKRPIKDRLDCVQRFSDLLNNELDKLAKILSSEMGKRLDLKALASICLPV